ncbi:MAG: hypothetical protein ABWZ53_13760 [Actinomycetota bacterium]
MVSPERERGMDEHDELFSPAEGPSPNDDDADEGEAMETFISGMDRPLGSEDHTTAEEQREGDTIDDRTRREQPQRERPDTSVDLVDGADESGVDRDPEMVADAEEPDGPEGPEQAAVHIVDNEPGVTDHPDDYVG